MRDDRALSLAISRVALTAGTEGHRDAERAFGYVFGLVPATTFKRRHRCLRALSGDRCRRGPYSSCDGCDPPRNVFDHVALWRRPDESRTTVLTSQPYGGGIYQARQLARKFDLSLLVSRELSWHAPGATTLLVFDAAGVIS